MPGGFQPEFGFAFGGPGRLGGLRGANLGGRYTIGGGGGWSVQACPKPGASAFLQSLGINDVYLNTDFDRCYCQHCYKGPKTIDNEGPTPYVVPGAGWVRFGLKTGPRAKAQDVFNKWCACYHGVKSKMVLDSILDCGGLVKPGSTLLDGTVLTSAKCAGRTDEVVYTSPTVKYAGLKFYAEPIKFTTAEGVEMRGSIALQCRQKPGTFESQGETMAFARKKPEHLATHCPDVNLAEIEWKSIAERAVIPYGLLVRVWQKGHDKDADAYSSPVDGEKWWAKEEGVAAEEAAWSCGDYARIDGGYDCPGKHGLTRFIADHRHCSCDVCRFEGDVWNGCKEGDILYGCRQCDYDVCASCRSADADVKVGRLTMDPDSDREVRLEYADGSMSDYTNVSRLTAADASEFQTWSRGDYARIDFDTKVGMLTMDPRSDDGTVRLEYADGSKSSFINVWQLTKADASEFQTWSRGDYARIDGGVKVGMLTMDPDSDGEVRLEYADGSKSDYTNVSRLTAADASEFQTWSRGDYARIDQPVDPGYDDYRDDCPSNHGLTQFNAEHDGYRCDGCGSQQSINAMLHGCRRCDYDLCASCYQVGLLGAGKVGRLTMDPRSDGKVRLEYADGSKSGFINVRQLTKADASEFQTWSRGDYARIDGGVKVGMLTMDPDSDREVRLEYADGSKSDYTNVSRLTAADASEFQTWSRGDYARIDGGVKVGMLTMDPRSDGKVRLEYADGSKSGFINVRQLTKADASEFQTWSRGDYARIDGGVKVGMLTMDPDSDREVRLEYADGSKSDYTNVSRLTAADASEFQTWSRGDYARIDGGVKVGMLTTDPLSDMEVRLEYADGSKSDYTNVSRLTAADTSDFFDAAAGKDKARAASVKWFKEVESIKGAGKTADGGFTDWFHGIITRIESEDLLQQQQSGTFLIRVAESRFGYTLSLMFNGRCKHFKIDQNDQDRYLVVGNDRTFPSLNEVLAFHMKHPVTTDGDVLLKACPVEGAREDLAELQ